ncbi:hypothetical protein [Burkholderia anthina]|uniref:hypothetical protein n=1 Tax=Burkholderia anthina TaxID=179879 RepID=UPI00158C91A8
MAYFMGYPRASAAIAGVCAVGLVAYRTVVLSESLRDIGTDLLVAIVLGVVAFLFVVMSGRSKRIA